MYDGESLHTQVPPVNLWAWSFLVLQTQKAMNIFIPVSYQSRDELAISCQFPLHMKCWMETPSALARGEIFSKEPWAGWGKSDSIVLQALTQV